MHPTKDSFYLALRNRLAAYDPQRTIIVNGATRPAILVAENEAPEIAPRVEGAFCLTWESARPVQPAISTLLAMDCVISYRTSGSSLNGEFDRGRTLAALDADLLAICAPAQTPKCDYSNALPVALGSMLFWMPPLLSTAKETTSQCVGRDARVTIFFYPEVNEP
jgi:hypothetical protein